MHILKYYPRGPLHIVPRHTTSPNCTEIFVQRGHGACGQSYKINTIIQAIATFYTHMLPSSVPVGQFSTSPIEN